jgi:phage terminase large subunit-like protein
MAAIAATEKARAILSARKARTDFKTFFELVWANEQGFQLAPFHEEAIEVLTDWSERYVYWEAARGHAKSAIVTALAVWLLGRDPNHRIKIVCSNDKEARKRLYEIKEQIAKNQILHYVFPELKQDPDGEWNKSRIYVKRGVVLKDPSIEAMGVMSGSLGSRATVILFDDIVDLRNSILQPQLKEHVRQKVFAEIIPLLEPVGIVRGIGTPWTLTDCNQLMRDNWRLIGPHRVGTGTDIFEPIWPYKFTRELLEKLHRVLGPAEYARAYLCQALTGDTVPIQNHWIQFYDGRVLGDPYQHLCLHTYDLAIALNDQADYFAHVNLLWDPVRRYVFVPNAWHDRLTFRQQVRAIVSEAETWNPQEIVIESGGYQGALASHLAEETSRALPVQPFRNRGRSKERRLVEASPFLEQGRVFFHPRFHPTLNPEIGITGDIVGELTSFPFGRHDDMVDALVQGLLTILELDPDASPDLDDDTGFMPGSGISMRMTAI